MKALGEALGLSVPTNNHGHIDLMETHSPALTTASPPFTDASPKSSASPSGPTFNPRSCTTCRKRKVRCDKISSGCTNCFRAHIPCGFPAPGRAPRRQKNALSGRPTSDREVELLKRLRRLEGVVEELSGQVDGQESRQISGSPQASDGDRKPHDKSAVWSRIDGGTATARVSSPLDSPVEKEFGRLVLNDGKSRYISNTFWASLSEEVDDIKGILDDATSDESDSPSPTWDSHDHQSFILGYSSSKVSLRSFHPLPSQIPFYWQVYTENIDPIVKILHKPTMEKTVKEIKGNLDSLSRSTEALMFSIYFAVITSMGVDEVKANFGLEKTFILNRYRFAVEQALARAGFLNTSEIVTVQAFLLFLVCVRRHDDSRFVWTLTGLLIRIAQSLGLHRDGAIFGLSPFDIEMRRRLWWQVCLLDVRASEDHGTDPSINSASFDTNLPLNIDDDMLDPEATELPAPRVGVSELSFCLVRYEISRITRRLHYVPRGDSVCETCPNLNLAEKEKIVQDSYEMLEAKYLRYFQDQGPLFWVAATVSRLVIAKMGLIIYHPLHNDAGIRNEIPPITLQRLFIASIDIIEYGHLLETEPSTKKWGWLFHTHIQWHAIAYLLSELCIRNYDENVRRAWTVLANVFEDWGGALRHSKNGMLWIPIRKLMARARRKRDLDLARMAAARPTYELASTHADEADAGNPFLESDCTSGEEYRTLYLADQMAQMRKTTSGAISGVGSRGENEIEKVEDLKSMGIRYGCPTFGLAGQQPLPPPMMQQQQQQEAFSRNDSGGLSTTIPEHPPVPVDYSIDMDGLGCGDLDMDDSWQGWDGFVRDLSQAEGGQGNLADGGSSGTGLGVMGTWW